MLHRKLHQFCNEGREVCIFLRDQQRWIEEARIVSLEGDLMTVRYEIDEDEEISSWEEIIRIESIASITHRLASVSRADIDPLVSDDCPEAEQIYPRYPDYPQE
ncbi:UNVERIFIED_CONTAM: hypothetical protein BEN50_02600 [Euhalothece sp. KZN 001]